MPPSRTLAACGPAPALLEAAHLTKGKADMRRLMVMALPLLLAIPVAAQEQDADDSTEIGSGMASYYGDRFAGNRTASGESFDPDELTAAHRTLAFGPHVRATKLAHGKSVNARLNKPEEP